jgi:hypothetical protein
VVLWCSYLLDEEPVHLSDIFHAGTGETRQFWSLPYVPGTRYADRPVYMLTSSHTFSGGEDFCYTLQALGRAELIGETTGGGAHPTRGFPSAAPCTSASRSPGRSTRSPAPTGRAPAWCPISRCRKPKPATSPTPAHSATCWLWMTCSRPSKMKPAKRWPD